jgi:NADH-quinone oxidoreductase subunit G
MSVEEPMTKIRIDGKYYKVKPEKNLLETCMTLGIDIPHFCFHPALGSVGACRLCAVKKFRDKNDNKGRIIMSCMEPVTEGLIVSTDDAEVKAFRAAVIESLMTNHPHDCPVCDEGGECHLQDMTVMTGHNYRRFDFPKRTYNDQYLGPFINHEMNRCIQCYRCVRFYRDYAGGKDLNAFASRNHVYFGRHEDGTLENEFSGNLVEVCPTGVFTDKTLKKHFTRKWDLSNAPSICVHCSVGCNTIASERYDSLRRIMSRYNGAVNGYFICDRGRFGYEFVNDEKRIRKTKIRIKKTDNQEEVENETLLSTLGMAFSKNNKIIGIGSSRASIESNFALSVLVGKENFYHGISKKEHRLTKTIVEFLQNSGVQTASLKQIERADTIVVLGEDLTNTAPMIALAIRQAARNVTNETAVKKGIPLWNDAPVRELAQDAKSPVYIATPIRDALDEIAENIFRASYTDIANLGSAVASAISDKAPVSKIKIKDQPKLAQKIALSLKNAKNPLIISGITCGEEEIVNSALNIANALLSSGKKVMLSMVLPECNSMGLALIPGKPFDDPDLFTENKEIDNLIILENDLYRRSTEESVNQLFESSRQIIVLDHLMNKTSFQADILLPSATFAESEGTIVNNEGRAQRYYKAMPDKDQVKESWQWINELVKIRDEDMKGPWSRFDDVVTSMVDELPVFSKLKEYMPDADFRMLNAKIPRQTIRYSGRTAINTNITVSEPKLLQDPDSSLAFSMEGQPENPPSSLVPFYWIPGWNSVQAMSNYLDELNGSMKGGDPGIRLIEPTEGQIYSYFNISSQTLGRRTNEWLIVPVYQIYGSEELSSVSSSVAERIKEPCLYLNQKDAEIFVSEDMDLIRLKTSKSNLKLRVKIENSLPQGIAGLPVNLPGMQFIDLPGFGEINKL